MFTLTYIQVVSTCVAKSVAVTSTSMLWNPKISVKSCLFWEQHHFMQT